MEKWNSSSYLNELMKIREGVTDEKINKYNGMKEEELKLILRKSGLSHSQIEYFCSIKRNMLKK